MFCKFLYHLYSLTWIWARVRAARIRAARVRAAWVRAAWVWFWFLPIITWWSIPRPVTVSPTFSNCMPTQLVSIRTVIECLGTRCSGPEFDRSVFWFGWRAAVHTCCIKVCMQGHWLWCGHKIQATFFEKPHATQQNIICTHVYK